jgi:hypothetical protein
MSYISSPPWRLHGSIGTILLYFTLVSVQKTKYPFLLNNSVAPEPAGSSPYLQELTTGPYPEPTVSTHTPSQTPNIHSDPILPSTPRSSELSLSFGLYHQNPLIVTVF